MSEQNIYRKRIAELEAFVKDIIPMAMWVSCAYRSDPEADATTHCCDWNAVVEHGRELLGGQREK